MILFVLHDPGDRLDEGVRSFYQCFGFREWPIKHDGNEHLSSIFFDEGWFSSLHLFQDCNCFVLTQVFVPTLLKLFALVIRFEVGLIGPLGFLVLRGKDFRVMWQLARL